VFDDFGTGFASLSYLKKFPLDGLKIDRSFVLGLLANPDDAAIVSSTIGLSKQLGLSVIAEASRTGPRPISWSAWAARKARAISSGGRCRPAISRPNSSLPRLPPSLPERRPAAPSG
jgi:EAL domain